MKPGFAARFAVAVLATWRVAHLVAREDGPADVVFRLRARLGDGRAGTLVDCFSCVSVWVAAPCGLYVGGGRRAFLPVWAGLSGAAVLLDSARDRAEAGHRIPSGGDHERKEAELGLLWPEASGAAER